MGKIEMEKFIRLREMAEIALTLEKNSRTGGIFGGRKYGHLNYRKPAAEDVISAAGCFLPRINKASQS